MLSVTRRKNTGKPKERARLAEQLNGRLECVESAYTHNQVGEYVSRLDMCNTISLTEARTYGRGLSSRHNSSFMLLVPSLVRSRLTNTTS